MTTELESNIYRKLYWAVLALLLINNLLGIALNPGFFFLSLLFFIGIPGAALVIHYLVGVIRLRPLMLIVPHILAIIYNYFVNEILFEEAGSSEIVGGQIWPQINIFLSAAALFISIIHSTLTQIKHEN